MIKTKSVQVIDDHDWDELVEKTYGKPYCLQQQDGCMERQNLHISVPETYVEDYENDTIPELVNGPEEGVSFKAWLARDPKKPLKDEASDADVDWRIELFWHRNFYPHLSMIINDLHAKGLLPAGEYEINIDW